MIIGNESLTRNVKIEGQDIEQVGMFKYLGVINSQGTLEDEVNERIAKTGKLYNAIETSFLSKVEIPQEVKGEMVRRVVKPILVQSCKLWSTNERRKQNEQQIEIPKNEKYN